MTKKVKAPHQTTMLEINTVNRLEYLYQGFSQPVIYTAKAHTGGEVAFPRYRLEKTLRGGRGCLEDKASLSTWWHHLRFLVGGASSGLPFQYSSSPSILQPPPTPSLLIGLASGSFPRTPRVRQHLHSTPSPALPSRLEDGQILNPTFAHKFLCASFYSRKWDWRVRLGRENTRVP